MENQNQHRTDIDKLTVLLPYRLNHNNDHIRDQERWLKKAEKEGLMEVADELKKAIDHAKKENRHVEQANLRLKIDESPSPLDSGQLDRLLCEPINGSTELPGLKHRANQTHYRQSYCHIRFGCL